MAAWGIPRSSEPHLNSQQWITSCPSPTEEQDLDDGEKVCLIPRVAGNAITISVKYEGEGLYSHVHWCMVCSGCCNKIPQTGWIMCAC